MKRFAVPVVLSIALIVAACGGDSGAPPVAQTPPAPTPIPPPPPPPPPPIAISVEREVAPAVTSNAITINLSPHIVINPDPAIAAKGRLFVMLPGTGGTPRN